MKKPDDENNQTGVQGYSGLTITELEKRLIGEEPESGIKIVFHAMARWGRLLAALSLALILLYGVFYIQNLKKEIKDLRSELDSSPGGVTHAENTGQVQPSEGAAPESPPENAEEQTQPVEDFTPAGPEEEPDGQGRYVEVNPAGSPQTEDDGQSRPVEGDTPANSEEESVGQSQPVDNNQADIP